MPGSHSAHLEHLLCATPSAGDVGVTMRTVGLALRWLLGEQADVGMTGGGESQPFMKWTGQVSGPEGGAFRADPEAPPEESLGWPSGQSGW